MQNIFGFVEMFCIFVLPSGLMATIKTNKMRKELTKSEVAPNLKAGDIIEFTNKSNFKVIHIVFKVDEKSWYCMFGSRRSYGSLKSYMKYPDFKIVSN
jgi:hypothetical protein